MSRPTTSQPETHGVTHTGQAPQVAVRDGNRLLCPCCGQTLMVLKEKRFAPPKKHHLQGDPRRTWPSLERLIAEQEAHYQNGAAEEVPQVEPRSDDNDQDRPAYRADALVVPIDPQVAAYTFPPQDPPPHHAPKAAHPVQLPGARLPEVKLHSPLPRSENGPYDQRRRNTRSLEDPFTYQGARLFAWAYYRLKRLAVQLEKEIAEKQAETQRLQAELDGGKQEQASSTRPDRTVDIIKTHAQADLGVAPEVSRARGKVRARGMVACNETQRHAHEDEGMAPASVSVQQPTTATAAKERGPP